MATITALPIASESIGTPCCPPAIAPALSEAEAETYAAWFKALADPTRVRILNLLAQSNEALCVCEIVDHFPLGQPAISHHLRILKNTRFVLAERRGTFMYYQLNQACLAAFLRAARSILNV